MSWGYNPFITEKSPYHGAYLAVVESASKLVAAGASFEDVYLTFQEYFLRVGKDAKRWGQPTAALLGAFKAQKELKIAAIGGKDSMSGTFEDLDVPPTLVSFAITTDKVQNIVSNEFKAAGHTVCLVEPDYDENGLPVTASLLKLFNSVTAMLRNGKAVAAYTLGLGGAAEAVMKMSFGNGLGFAFNEDIPVEKLFGYGYGTMFPAYNTLFINLAPNSRRATANATYLTGWDVGIGCGMLFGGMLAEGGYEHCYMLGTVLVVVALLFFVRVVTPHFQLHKLR